ncbi:MAG: PilZ domain-containing protein [Acidobacteria bacterium]|nr:PilZ domain-containing protein [Acidobacteriota bacterium]
MGIENRKFRRVVVGPELTASFVHGGQLFHRIGLGNVSLGGCMALIPGERSADFESGQELEALTLNHELLPSDSFTGRVTYALGAGDSDMTWVGIGVQFLEMGPALRNSLQALVDGIPDPD